MIAARGINTYRQVEVQSRSPLELVVMMYDGAIASLNEAGAAAARGDARQRQAAVSRALSILCSLQEHLNLKDGGSVAEELDRLYNYATRRLLDVTVKQDTAAIKEIHGLLGPVRDAWHQISTQPPAAAAGRP